MNLDILSTVIQGGAVGLMALSLLIAYKLAVKLIGVGQALIGNHLTSLTEEVKTLRVEISLLSGRLLDILNRRTE